MRQKHADLQEAGVQIIALTPDNQEKISDLHRILKLPYPLLADPDKSAYEQYDLLEDKKIYGANFILDGQGVVRYAYRGVTPEDRPPLKELVEAGRAIAAGKKYE
ncbi:peroxiredoxin-like bacterioferritin comigratory protein [Dethiobacter alkaliphilus AHT 1]|uniref:Peroxiredoxin-like bacterioferritin comigratory protein n=1 Tax=Dethiobacter alkaliphilus AHT 1 TaxID=555088 RepID=C0GJ55_DETAL|nr:peroxiredoxin-like bacterioferritin comigratory protein [Dethiobacter alkaliphilus AHT 1]